MNLIKQLYLNSEKTKSGEIKSNKIFCAYPAASGRGGVEFYAAEGDVTITYSIFNATDNTASIKVDGLPAWEGACINGILEIFLPLGNHTLDINVSGTHSGFSVGIEGRNVSVTKPYAQRIGGSFNSAEDVFFVKNNCGTLTNYRWSGGTLTTNELSGYISYDAAERYDHNIGVYTGTFAYLYANLDGILGFSQGGNSFAYTEQVKLSAITDGKGYDGIDYLGAYIVDNILYFCKITESGVKTNGTLTINDVVDVQSAARGSGFMYKTQSGSWYLLEAEAFHEVSSEGLLFFSVQERGALCFIRTKISVNMGVPALVIENGVIYYYMAINKCIYKICGESKIPVCFADMYIPSGGENFFMINGGCVSRW